MRLLNISFAIEVYASEAELSVPEQELMAQARLFLDHAYAPYSGFSVGAAVRLANGRMVGGSNLENASYPLCLCAERAVLAAAASAFPKEAVTAMAITVRNPGKPVLTPVGPCGACRQVISETEDRFQRSMVILLQGEKGEVYRVPSGKALLPLHFDQSYLIT